MATVQAPPGKKSAQGQQKAKAALVSPIPTQKPRRGRRLFMMLLIVAMVVAAAYGLINYIPPVKTRAERLYEPVRAWAEKIPLVGPRFFAKKESEGAETPAGANGQNGEQSTGPGALPAAVDSAPDPAAQALEELARREAAVAFAEEQVKQKEAALADREGELNRRQVEFDKKEEEIERLRLEMEARIREDKARAEIVGNMKTAQAVAMLNVMDDEEVLRLMRYLEPDVTAKIFAAMDPYRGARLMLKLGGGEATDTY